MKSKGDQTGRNRDQAWHVYPNPNNPAVCPVLAMACYIFANPGIFGVDCTDSASEPNNHNGRLFPGSYQYERFMDCLHRIIAKYHEDFFCLGISAGDLGLHSARKGSSSYACAGSTVSPPMVSVCLRAMWSMGDIKERYLQYEKAGDQYLGRVVCGLDVNDALFAISPPFLTPTAQRLRRFISSSRSTQSRVTRLVLICIKFFIFAMHHCATIVTSWQE